MLTSHSIPQACWNVIIKHPFWGAAEQVLVLYVPRPFLLRVAVKVGKGSGYARLLWAIPFFYSSFQLIWIPSPSLPTSPVFQYLCHFCAFSHYIGQLFLSASIFLDPSVLLVLCIFLTICGGLRLATVSEHSFPTEFSDPVFSFYRVGDGLGERKKKRG